MPNLAQLRRAIVARITTEWRDSVDSYSVSQIDTWINDAYLSIQRKLMILKAGTTQNLVAGQYAYDAPSDILDKMTVVNGVQALSVTGERIILRRMTWDDIREKYGVLAQVIPGTPDNWAFSEIADDTIVVLPPPDATIPNGLCLDYIVRPSEMSRVYQPASITASVTSGSPTVTFSASIAGNVEAGDEFGVSDGTEIPFKWYRVLEIVNNTQITLSLPYTSATASGQSFAISETSQLERRRPGLIGYAPVEYALLQARLMDDGPENQGAILQSQLWQAELDRIKQEGNFHEDVTDYGVDSYSRHPGVRR